MEQQILKAINHIKYVSKEKWPYPVYKDSLKKKSNTAFDETSVEEIGKIDCKFKIIILFMTIILQKTPFENLQW